MANREEARGFRVIDGGGTETFIPLDRAAEVARDRRILRNEAETLEIQIGKNPYSDFILKHDRRPPPVEAATIGRMIGFQVKASDGSMQPRRTKAERAALRYNRQMEYKQARISLHAERLRLALACLSENEDDPQEMMDEICAIHGSEIEKNLGKSVIWLKRFVQEWHRHEKRTGTGSPEFDQKDYG